MKFLELLASILLNTTLLALIGVGALVVGSLLPVFGAHRVFVVQSGSMEPALLTGSVILINPESIYHTGDIVTWQPANGGTPITHRIVKEISDSETARYQTKGDANESEDAVISRSQIVGKVVFHVPYLGYPVSFAKRPIGFILLILFPSLLIVFDEILNLRQGYMAYRYRKRERKQTTVSQSIPSIQKSLCCKPALDYAVPSVSSVPPKVRRIV